jgi:hypothetical protein
MRSRALGVLGLASVFGFAVVLAVAATDRRELAFEVGLPAVRVVAELMPGQQTCREDIDVAASFSRVRVVVDALGRPGPALGIEVADRRTRRVLGSARSPGGYSGMASLEADVGPVADGRRARVCVRNEGAGPVAIHGSPPATPPDLLGDPERRPLPAFTFLREDRTSMLSLLPEALRRAALFRPRWVGAWTYWVLLVVAVLGVPALLAAALRSAYTSERSYSSTPASERGAERSS